MLNKNFPFDPSLRHHFIIGVALAIWIFVFLFLTEPLDVNELGTNEKLLFLPLYGLVGALAYIAMLPFQRWLYMRNKKLWPVKNEIIFLLAFTALGLVLTRSIYLYVVVPNEPYPYSLYYFVTAIYLPAISTIFPIVLIGRWAFGKYREKRLEDQKIEIEGEGTYEGLRLVWNDLIAVKADDNYVEISYLNSGSLKKQLIRNRLSQVEKDLPELLRTHRSHLINPYHFQQFKMNSGKLTALLSHAIEIPISKTYAQKVKQQIEAIKN